MKYFIIILIFFYGILQADIPEGYYDGTEGLTGDELKTALYNIIKDHIEFPYSSTNTDVWDILKVTDADPVYPDSVILIYTGWKMNGELEFNNGNGWNREHVWAKSHGDFGITMGPGTDVHHLRSCDISVNSERGNKDFDNGGEEYIDPDGATGCYTTAYTWEPRAEVKGDVARMIFYMAVRYEGENDEPDLEMVDYVHSAPNSEPFHGKLSTLLQWHIADPVDDWEENRNDIIYDDYQNNRNPFIDIPEFAELIWENVMSDNNILTTDFKLHAYPNPFNPSGAGRSPTTTIYFTVADVENAEICPPWQINIYNIKGQKIKTLLCGESIADGVSYSISWDGTDDGGKPVSSGVYFYKLQSGRHTSTKKMILMK
ncbi:MAG: endonuclease [Armatimonadetes bacterium]|nr:endonuclease [Armatimonadota bacterium]